MEVLSTGTREQLFVSLRLAMVAMFARRGIQLPMILDDVCVNFDIDRTQIAINVICDFAKQGHQVLMFTCHEHVWRMFKEINADVRRLPDRFTNQQGFKLPGEDIAEDIDDTGLTEFTVDVVPESEPKKKPKKAKKKKAKPPVEVVEVVEEVIEQVASPLPEYDYSELPLPEPVVESVPVAEYEYTWNTEPSIDEVEYDWGQDPVRRPVEDWLNERNSQHQLLPEPIVETRRLG